MTGRLEGTALGRPVRIEATGRLLTLHVGSLGAAWRLRRFADPGLRPLVRAARHAGLPLRVTIGKRLSLGILPHAHFAVKMLVGDPQRM